MAEFTYNDIPLGEADGGELGPVYLAGVVYRYVTADLPEEVFGPRPERRPLSRRDRFRIWRSHLRWGIHNFLFPDCVCGDE